MVKNLLDREFDLPCFNIKKNILTIVMIVGMFFGGDKEDRTPDLLTASQTLSQLSYAPKFGLPYNSIIAHRISIPKLNFLCFTLLCVALARIDQDVFCDGVPVNVKIQSFTQISQLEIVIASDVIGNKGYLIPI